MSEKNYWKISDALDQREHLHASGGRPREDLVEKRYAKELGNNRGLLQGTDIDDYFLVG